MRRFLESPWLAPAVALAGLAFGVAAWLALTPAQIRDWMSEAGPVEQLTAVLYAACAAMTWLLRDRRGDWKTWAALATLMLAFCLRELDWHKAWTGTSVLKLGFYLRPAPLLPKLVALAVLLPVVAAAGHLVRRGSAPLWTAWRRRDPVAITIVVYLASLVFAKAIDRSLGIAYEDFGLESPTWLIALRSAVEESLELALSAMATLGVLQHRARRVHNRG